jgi:nickel transport system substrate-binding protein
MMMSARGMFLAIAATAVAADDSTLVVTVGTQNGFFQSNPSDPAISGDIGPMNPHDYRPNEFVANDFIFEGLVAWDGESPAGLDNIIGTEDDYVVPSLATNWATAFDGDSYTITFTLRSGVTFHDGSAWNANVAVLNFEQIMGGTGVLGSFKALRGMHDWLGFTQYLDAYEAVDELTFSLTFTNYYEAALRELATIRPFRMSSAAALPSLANYELSHLAARGGVLRNPWPPRCAARGLQCYMLRGVSAPIGTGPYRVVDKLLSSGRRLPSSQFNATCYSHPSGDDRCVYNAGEYVQEVLFTKFAGHWKNPTYNNVILRAYPSQKAVSDALKDGSLDIAYGVNTLSASNFISLATAEGGGSQIVAHQAATDLNVRTIVINSGSIITQDMRKYVMEALAAGRQALYNGELAEERPYDTLFDPAAPHCSVLSTLTTPEELAATRSPLITSANFTKPLRLLYRAYEPHSAIIAAEVQALLFAAGITVTPMATKTRDEYNGFNCNYKDAFSYGGTPLTCEDDDLDCLADYHSWDLSISQTWGPPYDPTAKLWDMTHLWCSGESDAPAVANMESMTFDQFKTNVRSLSNIRDRAAREAAYSNVLQTLHDEAIFLPITAKRQTAATNVRVSGFKFGYMEFDLPLANLYPTPPPTTDWEQSATAAGWQPPCTDGGRRLHEVRKQRRTSLAHGARRMLQGGLDDD